MEQEERNRRQPRDRAKPLPPLDYLLAFEAAAEQMGFAGASKVLNLSETAISRKVRLLELHFGLNFFERGHRSVTLTQYGREFLTRIQPALDALRAAADDTLKTGQNRPVVLAATNSVAALWLTPRLRKFREANKHLNIMLVASDDDEECLADMVDLTILRGDGDWPGYDAELVFGETIFPVCSPDFLAANPDVSDAGSLPNAQLIEVSSSHTEWMNWRTWLGQTDVPFRRLDRTMMFNTYPLSIHAAVDGVGVALGWGHLVDQLLEAGKLVRPLGNRHVRTDHGYYLLTPRNRPAFPGRQEVAAWLMSISAERRRYGDTMQQGPES
ncbi:MAG: LysR substrate-binding domain-containing protein [Albidovulum sp.]|uniref:LysR substrate-binding domain-containing protein n=1 Tax=Albidovulum sp. TaxID=1872424 RepID=UPI003C838FD6